MPTCPSGHESSASDFCDVCGIRIGAAATAAPAAGADDGGGTGQAAATPSPGEPCPQCGTSRNGKFCEVCGFNFATGMPGTMTRPPAPPPDPAMPSSGAPPPVPAMPGTGAPPATVATSAPPPMSSAVAQPFAPAAAWSAVVTADRDYFEGVVGAGGPDAASIEFPAYCPERRFQLTGKQMRVGRYSASRGLEPEIDLTGPPADPGVSHLHAILIAQPDGTWAILDPGSSNGTQLNGQDLSTGVPYPLHPGDRISMGAWTVLTINA